MLTLLALWLPMFAPCSGAAELRLSDSESRVPLAPLVEAYEDTGTTLGIKEVIRQGRFAPHPELLIPGYTQSAIWLKFTVVNTSSTPLLRWLAVKPTRLREVSLFVPQGTDWQRIDGGTRRPFSRRPVAATISVLPVSLAPHTSQTLYLRVASTTSIVIEPTLWEPLAFREARGYFAALDGLLLGSLVITAFYGLLMFVTLRDRAFLLLALTDLVYCLYEAGFKGYSFMILWPDATDWATRNIGLFALLTNIGLLLFIRELLQARTRLPRWDRLLLTLFFVQSVAAVGMLFGDYRTWTAFATAVSSVNIVAILSTTTLTIVRQFPVSRFYVAAFAIILLGSIARSLALYGFIDYSLVREYATPCSIVVGNIFMLAAIVDGIMRVRREKEEAQQALLAARAAHEAQLERAVEERTVEILAAHQSQNRLLAYLSHDMRAPLATIVNYVHRLNRNADEEARKYQAAIERSATYQLELIDEVVEFTRGELDRLELLPIPHYLHSWLGDIAHQTELLSDRNNNRFSVRLTGDIPLVAVFDPKRLRQVLINLLNNATKFTANGEVRLLVEAVKAPGRRVNLAFTVEDTGPGISDQDLERIFLPFERCQFDRQGHGLGLSIARKLVHAMGGELSVESTLGRGSRFNFGLTLDTADEADVAQPMQAFVFPAPFGAGKTLLTADDNPASLDYLHDVLATAEFEVVSAENGTEALRLALDHRFDAVMVDQTMPGLSGWEVLQKLHEARPDTMPPVILCSAAQPQRPAGFPAGLDFDASLTKPVAAEQLLQLMQKLMNPTPAIAMPPTEALAPLRHMLSLGIITDIEQWAAALAGEHPQYADFANRVKLAAAQLDMSTLTILADGE